MADSMMPLWTRWACRDLSITREDTEVTTDGQMAVNWRFLGSGHPPGALHRVTPHLSSDTEKLLSLHVTAEEAGCWGVSLSAPVNRRHKESRPAAQDPCGAGPAGAGMARPTRMGWLEALPVAGVRTAQAHRDVGLCPWGSGGELAGQSESLGPVTLTSVS